MNAASVGFNLLRVVVAAESLGLKPLENAVTAARAYSSNVDAQVDKAMVNVGALLAEQVSGRVSTEIDPRLAHDTGAMVSKAKTLAALYSELKVGPSRLLFRLPGTWEGVCAAKELEAAGLQSQIGMVHSMVQGVAAAQAGASLITVNVGRTRDFYNKNPGVIRDPHGPRQDAGSVGTGTDPGVHLVTDIYNYLQVHHPRSQLMAAGLRSRADALALAGCPFLLLPAKVISELRAVPTTAGYNNGLTAAASSDDPLSDFAALSPSSAREAGVAAWAAVDAATFRERLGMAGEALLAASLKDALKDVEALASLNKATTGRSST